MIYLVFFPELNGYSPFIGGVDRQHTNEIFEQIQAMGQDLA